MAGDQLHPTRQIQAFRHISVASGATGAKVRVVARHQLHPTRQIQAFRHTTVAPSAVGNKKPTHTRHQPHPTRQKHDYPSKTVAPSAVGALAAEEKPLDRSKNQRLIDSKALASTGTYCVRRSQGLVSSDRRFSYWYSTLYRITLSTPIS